MGCSEEVVARCVHGELFHSLAVFAHVEALGERHHHAELVGVHHELLVADGEAALHPASRVQYEVDACHDGRDDRRSRLVCRLSVRQLRCGQ